MTARIKRPQKAITLIRPAVRRQIPLPDLVERVISDHQSKLWQVRAMLRCLLKAGESADGERTDGDIDYTLDAALAILDAVVVRLEPSAITTDAVALEDGEVANG